MGIWYMLWELVYILWVFGICYGYLVYFMVIWYILWAFGIGILWLFDIYLYFPFWYVVPVQIWQPWSSNVFSEVSLEFCPGRFQTEQ
jgi:hypothetical protein